MGTQAPFHLAAGVPFSSIISTAFVTIMLLLILKSSHVADVRNFVLSQENIAAQRKLIELNIEFSDRLKAFIPKVIADRIEALVTQKRVSVLQAAVDVLKPRKAEVSCLFSDIRGFTKGSRDLDAFINRSVLPEMKACSNVVEEFGGIPRKIGDLIFAYFDDEDRAKNVGRCLMAAIDISRVNQELNSRGSRNEIRRYILVSTGEAIVGNLGGLDSSIEITALGPPVNFLSRLDELTKNPYLGSQLVPGDVLVCGRTISTLEQYDVHLELDAIDLVGSGLTVRDFPDVQTVFRLRNSARAYETLQAWQHQSNNVDVVASGESSNGLRYAG
jgi:class 3 adenylate cyclase